MNNRDKALFTGFIIGAVILGFAGFLLAPHLLAIAGVGITHTVITNFAVNNFLFGIPTATVGVTAAALGQLQAGIAVLTGIVGGLAGGLIGVSTGKKENSSTSQCIPSPPVAHASNIRTNEYAPQLDIDGETTGKSFVESYKREKAAKVVSPSTLSL